MKIPQILWEGTCPRINVLSLETRKFRCVETMPEPGTSWRKDLNGIVVEMWSEDAMGVGCWEKVDYSGGIRTVVLEEALMNLARTRGISDSFTVSLRG